MTRTCNMTPEAEIDRPESMNEKERLEQKLRDWGAMKAFLVSEEGRKKYGDEMRNVILERVKRNINEIEERLRTITAGPGPVERHEVLP